MREVCTQMARQSLSRSAGGTTAIYGRGRHPHHTLPIDGATVFGRGSNLAGRSLLRQLICSAGQQPRRRENLVGRFARPSGDYQHLCWGSPTRCDWSGLPGQVYGAQT